MSSTYRLGDLTVVERGRVPANTARDPEGRRIFARAEIASRGLSAPRYVVDDPELENAATVAEGDVVLALLGNIADAALIDSTAAGAVLGRECAALRVMQPDVIHPGWLCAWITSEEFKSQLTTNVTGTTMPRLSPNALADFTVTVPPIEKQRDIEELVGHFDAAISTTATTLRQLQDLRATELQLAMAKAEKRP